MNAPARGAVDLGKHLVSVGLVDVNGHRAGVVADLVFGWPEAGEDGTRPGPAVTALVTGPMAVAGLLPRPLAWLARRLYQLAGVRDPQPVVIHWSHVTAIDVMIHLDVSREEAGLTGLADAVNRRFITRLPGA